MSTSLQLLIEPTSKKAVSSLYSEQPLILPPLFHGETVNISVTKVERIANPTSSQIWRPITDASPTDVSFGKAYQLPQAGVFTLTYGANTTTDLGYQPTAAEIETALNLLASVIAAGGVTVREPDDAAGNYFLVTFDDNGARTVISGDETALAPPSVIDVGTLVDGDASTREIQSIRIIQQPAASVTLGGTLSAATVTPTLLQAGDATHNARYRVSISPTPIGGYFTLLIDHTGPAVESGLIAINSSEDEIIAILEAMSNIAVGDVDVIEEGNYSWIIAFQGALALTAVTVTATSDSLTSLPGQTGELELSTAAVEMALAGAEETEALLQVIVTPAGEGRQVWLQEDVTLTDSLTDPSSTTPTPSSTTAEAYFLMSGGAIGITSLTGGTSIDLDSLVTLGRPNGRIVTVNDATEGFGLWELAAGTTAEDAAAGVVRPDDYAASTNERVWLRRL